MTRYGFRIHELRLSRGPRGRRDLELDTCTNQHERDEFMKGKTTIRRTERDFLDLLEEQLQSFISDDETLTDKPTITDEEFRPSTSNGTPRLNILRKQRNGRRLSVEVEYGHLGLYTAAVTQQKKNRTSLQGSAAVQHFRLEFLAPEGDDVGYIAAETIRGAQALPVLVSWLNYTACAQEGDDMVRLKVVPLTDMERVKRLLNGADAVAEIQVKRTKNATVDGAPQDSGRIILKEELRASGGKMQQLWELINRWNDKGFKYDKDGELEEVKALASIIGEPMGEFGFDDGVICLDAENGQKLTVRPSKLGELYNYPISEERPSDTHWDSQVKKRVLAIAMGDGRHLDWS